MKDKDLRGAVKYLAEYLGLGLVIGDRERKPSVYGKTHFEGLINGLKKDIERLENYLGIEWDMTCKSRYKKVTKKIKKGKK